MANDVIINGETYSGMDAVNLMKTDGTTETYYPDAVRYVPQNLTDEQKAQARANIGIEDADKVLVVSGDGETASHSSTEIKAAREAGKAVFLSRSSAVYPVTGFNDYDNVAVFDDYLFIPDRGYFLKTRHSIGADAKITVTQESTKVTDFVDSESDVLVVTVENNVASHSSSEIISAVNAGKAVFLSNDSVLYPIAGITADSPVFDFYVVIPNLGLLNHTRYSIGADKKITVTTDSTYVSRLVDSAIEELKENGELGSDSVLIVTATDTVASHSSTEIIAAVDAGKGVFFSKDSVVYPLAGITNGIPNFDVYVVSPKLGYLNHTRYSVDADKKITITTDSAFISNLVDAAIEELKANGELGVSNYEDLTNKPVSPAAVSSVAHQYAISNSKEEIHDVTTWATGVSSLTQRQRACVYGNGYYVVCGTSGEMVYSLDSVTWTTVTRFTAGVITGLAYGKGLFVAIDSNGVIWIAKEEPIEWEQVNITWEQLESGATQILEGICYANNRFIIVGDYGLVAFSDDGRAWKETRTAYDFKAVAFGNGKYVAAGNNGSVAVSYDGENWTDYSDASITGSYRAAAFGGNRFVIGCQGGIIRYSYDGRTWITATTDSTSSVNYIRGIVYAEGKFYAVMYVSTGKGEIWVSDDAETWTVQYVATGRLWCCAYGEDVVIASGDNGAIYTLNFGIEWLTKQPDLGSNQHLWERIVFTLSDGGTVIGDSVCIKSAPNTENWVFTLADGSTVTKAVNVG